MEDRYIPGQGGRRAAVRHGLRLPAPASIGGLLACVLACVSEGLRAASPSSLRVTSHEGAPHARLLRLRLRPPPSVCALLVVFAPAFSA